MRTSGRTKSLSNIAHLSLIAIATSAMVLPSAACTAETRIVGSGAGADGSGDDGALPDLSTVGDPTDKNAPAPPLAAGLSITDVAVFQAVKVPVVTAGAAVAPSARNAPVIVGRPALVRVYVTPDPAYDGAPVTAELRLVDGTSRLPIVKDTKSIASASTDADVASTFNFEVPAESLPAGVSYQVLLTSKSGKVPNGTSAARFPSDGGVQSLDAQASGKLKIVIVPVKYDYDGSGRTPDVSAAQLERYRQTFMAQYAVTDVEVTTREPWSYASAIAATGSGFSQVLDAVMELRKADSAATDVYYYGALAPTPSFKAFCARGCVTGLSTVVENVRTSFLRASVGVGFAGQDSANTAAHEIGHAHGRGHAPCGGAKNVDASFPYADGATGVWGYDILTKTFISPTEGRDLMGYCPNEWVSDYTFSALFTRIAAVNGAAPSSTGAAGGASQGPGQAFAASQTFRMAKVEADGSVSWGGDVELDEELTDGPSRLVTFVSSSGETLGTSHARFYPYDHLPGGVLVVPPAPRQVLLTARTRVAPAWSAVRIAGLAQTLPR